MNAEDIINKLEMLPHPEGGYYKETYRSEEQTINKEKRYQQVKLSKRNLGFGKDASIA